MQFNLEKSTQALQFELKKRDVGTIIPCQVSVTFDVSASFYNQHHNGYTQDLLNRFVPFAMLFDKNHTLDSFVFGTGVEQLEDINEHNYSSYIRNYVRRSGIYNSSTEYAPIFKELCKLSQKTSKPSMMNRLFGHQEKQSGDKYIHFFVTDGEAYDQSEALKTFHNLTRGTDKTFFVFISCSQNKLQFLQENFDNQQYSSYINFNLKQMENLGNMSDEDLFELLLSDNLVKWMAA